MNSQKLLVCMGLIGAIGGVGCGGSDPPPTPPPVVCDAAALASGESHLYVINILRIAAPDITVEPVTSAGFNIDDDNVVMCNSGVVGMTSEFNGQAPDFGSGIDNALGGELDGLASDGIQGGVDDANVLLLVDVRGVNDMMNDSCVGVNFYLGKLRAGDTVTPPATCPAGQSSDVTHADGSITCKIDPMSDGDGHLAPGQTFDLSSDSFTDGLAGTMPNIAFGSARIVAGRLQAGPSDFPLALNLLGADISLTIKNAQIRFDISADSVSAGVLGGSLNTAEVITTVESVPDLVTYVDIVRDTLTALADIDENDSPDSCEAGSISLLLGGVPATRGMVVTPPPTM